MKPGVVWLILVFLFTLCSCRKPIVQGKIVKVSGTVIDSVKNKKLANAKVYLLGARSTFYGTYYSAGPYDSTITDNSGNFLIVYTAEGQSIDYGVSLSKFQKGISDINQLNYVADPYSPISKLNFKRTVNNAIIKGRELNYLKIHLTVLSNPFDSFYVRNFWFDPVLIKGQNIDTIITLRHIPGEQLIISYYTDALRDTAGLAALNSNPGGHLYSVMRAINDTSLADFSDTIRIYKTISSSLAMPRQ